MAPSATRADVSRLLGEVDALVISRIVAVGASTDEIDEALRTSQDDAGFGEEQHEPSSPRVVEVRAILEELVLADEEDEQPVAEAP